MLRYFPGAYLTGTCLITAAFFSQPLWAASEPELAAIRAEVRQLKQVYEARIQALEARLQQTESAAKTAQSTATLANEKASQVAAAPQPATVSQPSGANAFNPEISLILNGTYASLSQDPNQYRITGFIPGGEIGPGKRSFSLGESELAIYANVDTYFRGGLTLAVGPGETVGVEEAFVQTLGLVHGFTLKAGRFFSGIGYLNERHAHTWDFVDNPLAYQAFLGTQLGEDGVQVKWLAPLDTFLEFGAELGRGANFPGAESNRNGAGNATLFAHVGGDIGASQSWRAGLSYLRARPQNRSRVGFCVG